MYFPPGFQLCPMFLLSLCSPPGPYVPLLVPMFPSSSLCSPGPHVPMLRSLLRMQKFDMLMNGDLYPYPTYFYNITGSTDYYNILNTKVNWPPIKSSVHFHWRAFFSHPIQEPAAYDYYVPFVNRSDTRFAIHVGNLSYGAQSVQVETSLLNVGVVMWGAKCGVMVVVWSVKCGGDGVVWSVRCGGDGGSVECQVW